MVETIILSAILIAVVAIIVFSPGLAVYFAFRVIPKRRIRSLLWLSAMMIGLVWCYFSVTEFSYSGARHALAAPSADIPFLLWLVLYAPGVPWLIALLLQRPRPFVFHFPDVAAVLTVAALAGLGIWYTSNARARYEAGDLGETDLVAMKALPKYRNGVVVDMEWTVAINELQAFLKNQRFLERFRTNQPSKSGSLHFLALNRNLGIIEIECGAADANLADVLVGLEKLEKLLLRNPNFHGEGLEKLATLPRLAELDVSQTGIGDDDASHIAALTQLKTLRLDDTPLGDIGLSELAPLQSLEHLSLIRTEITDWGLGVVADFPRLKEVHVEGTRVTKNGIAALRAKRPQLVVVP